MNRAVVPLWLIIAIVCLPPFGESLYSPVLPNIVSSLKISENTAEHTMTFFLIGFAIGICFWGVISDRIGRKRTLIISLGLYGAGCIGCLMAETISPFMMCRFIQALGGSACSGIGQAIARDVYNSAERNRLFSIAGIAVSLSAGMGPVLGGFMVERYNWSSVFSILLVVSFGLWGYITFSLKETNQFLKQKSAPYIPLSGEKAGFLWQKFFPFLTVTSCHPRESGGLERCCWIPAFAGMTKKRYTLKGGFGLLFKDKDLLNLVILMGTANGLIYCFYSRPSANRINKVQICY